MGVNTFTISSLFLETIWLVSNFSHTWLNLMKKGTLCVLNLRWTDLEGMRRTPAIHTVRVYEVRLLSKLFTCGSDKSAKGGSPVTEESPLSGNTVRCRDTVPINAATLFNMPSRILTSYNWSSLLRGTHMNSWIIILSVLHTAWYTAASAELGTLCVDLIFSLFIFDFGKVVSPPQASPPHFKCIK